MPNVKTAVSRELSCGGIGVLIEAIRKQLSCSFILSRVQSPAWVSLLDWVLGPLQISWTRFKGKLTWTEKRESLHPPTNARDLSAKSLMLKCWNILGNSNLAASDQYGVE